MRNIIRILIAINFAAFANFASAQILLDAHFNSGNPTQGFFQTGKLAFYPGYSAQIVSDITREGAGALRMEVRSTDPLRAAGRRAELNAPTASPINPDAEWYAFSTYIPNGYINDTRAELFFQVADTSSLTQPNLALWIRNGKIYVNQKYNHAGTNIETQTEISGNSNITTGAWEDWRIRYRRAINSTGLIQVYRNGLLVFSTTGPNANAIGGVLVPVPYMNIGIYKWPWNLDGIYYPNVRVMYFDKIMLGGKDSQLSDFNISGSGTTLPPPPPATAIPLQGFIFIPG